MTIRLAQQIGIESVVGICQPFRRFQNMKSYLSAALGATETTLMNTMAYGMIVKWREKVSPTFIDRVRSLLARPLENQTLSFCVGCAPPIGVGKPIDTWIFLIRANKLQTKRTTYQMVSILEGVVQRGTAKSFLSLDCSSG